MIWLLPPRLIAIYVKAKMRIDPKDILAGHPALQGRSRVISLADLKAEGGFVMAAPHRVLYANRAWTADAPPRTKVTSLRRRMLAGDDLF